MLVADFIKETAAGSFREVVALYAQANLLQIMQCAACNALHAGLIALRYGRIRVLKKRELQRASCECYGVIRDHFERLGL